MTYADRRKESSWPCEECNGSGGTTFARCEACLGHGIGAMRCHECGEKKPVVEFLGAKDEGKLVVRCLVCRKELRRVAGLSESDRAAEILLRKPVRADGPLRVKLVLESHNRKTGKIPVSMTSASTCPPTCSFMNAGCYAEQHLVGLHWRRVSSGEGLDWRQFCQAVRNLPPKTLWRHNEAGDLPGLGIQIDRSPLFFLVAANAGRKGFTYTHKPVLRYGEKTNEEFNIRRSNRDIIAEVNKESDFTINLSADSLTEADALTDLKIGPVTVVLPSDAPNSLRTPKGRHVVVCPAENHKTVTCKSCRLCAFSKRKAIVGFRAHGNNAQAITKKLRQLPLFAASQSKDGSA